MLQKLSAPLLLLTGVLLSACVSPLKQSSTSDSLPSKPEITLRAAPSEPVNTVHRMPETMKAHSEVLPLAQQSPFFEGIREDDLAVAQARVKKRLARHWKRLGERSVLVRARVLKVLHEMNAPEDLQVIPVVESAYQPYAMSRTGAMGLWQLMPRTAHALGVRSDAAGDGRRHVEFSTRAAVQYLMTQYQRFGNWPLAFAAYNMGPNGLARRLKKTPWQLQDGLMNMPVPRETKQYVQQIIGITALLHLQVVQFPSTVATREVRLQAPVDIQVLEKKLGLPKHYLFRLNPQLHYSQFLAHDVTIHVPVKDYEQVVALNHTWRPRYIHIRVKSGDSLWKLSRRYHVSIQRLRHLNPKLSRVLSIGQRLTVPARGYAFAVANVNPLLSQGRRIRYKVRSGDSLWRISKRFGTSMKAIARANQLSKHTLIRPGDTLWIYAHQRPS